METEISTLNLLSPLYYVPEEKPEPFGCPDGERLFCFGLNEAQSRSFEPDKEKLLGSLIFSGRAAGELTIDAKGKHLELPRGNYLFIQKRKILNREEISGLAVELQQEGLWQRLIPGDRLYLRYLFEDGSWVTQLLRPHKEQ